MAGANDPRPKDFAKLGQRDKEVAANALRELAFADLNARHDAAQREIRRLRKALSWYAHEDNWDWQGTASDAHDPYGLADKGERARAALAPRRGKR